jgi:hypothetical protein
MWNQLADTAAFFDVYAYNCEKNSAHLLKIREDMPDLISGYPTFIIYRDGEPVEHVGQKESQRSVASLLKVCMRVCREV